MGLPALKDQRQFERFQLINRQLPGQLRFAAGGEPIAAVAVDVSKRGLGIVGGEALAPDTSLELLVEGQVIPLRVVWNKKRKNMFRHGLHVTDPGIDLEMIFFAHGCIDLQFEDYQVR